MANSLVIAVIAAALLVACAGGAGPDLAGQPGLLLPVKSYYEFNASEEQGRCRNLLMDAVTGSEVISENGNQLVVGVRYRYLGELGGRASSGRKLRCRGSGERTFTVQKAGDRYRVLAMGGP